MTGGKNHKGRAVFDGKHFAGQGKIFRGRCGGRIGGGDPIGQQEKAKDSEARLDLHIAVRFIAGGIDVRRLS